MFVADRHRLMYYAYHWETYLGKDSLTLSRKIS